jgi:hypothetical protein
MSIWLSIFIITHGCFRHIKDDQNEDFIDEDLFRMMDFEKAFDDFLECHECDEAEAALFTIIRMSFKAGWLAAGGNTGATLTPLKTHMGKSHGQQ